LDMFSLKLWVLLYFLNLNIDDNEQYILFKYPGDCEKNRVVFYAWLELRSKEYKEQ